MPEIPEADSQEPVCETEEPLSLSKILILDTSDKEKILDADVGIPDHVVLSVTTTIRKEEELELLGKPDFLDELLERWKEKLVVVVSADMLRGHEIRIARGLAWETTVEDLIFELAQNPLLARFRSVKHVIVTFGADGAYWRSSDPQERPIAGLGAGGQARLVFDPTRAEGEAQTGQVDSDIPGLVKALGKELAQSGTASLDRTLIDILNGWAGKTSAFISVPVPAAPGGIRDRGRWSMLDQWQYHAARSKHPRPYFEIAQAVAVLGSAALERFPVAQFGNFSTVDRQEIESLRTIRDLIDDYSRHDDGKKPLCLGVFGAPGAGKSFGVTEIAKAVLGIKKDEIITLNLSQFSEPKEIISALHRVVEQRKNEKIPFVFWDEFDAQDYRWLQQLLAPMQDGAFQDGDEITTIGKCIFVFAGATSPTYQEFGPLNPMDASASIASEDRPEAERRWREFVLKKGPDFKTRLAAYLNVLGPNPRQIVAVARGAKVLADDPDDLCWPVRRALFIRGQFRLGEHDRLDMDMGVLRGLLEVPRYYAGSRSLEFLCGRLKAKHLSGAHHRSVMPGNELLGMHLDASRFWDIVERDREFEYESRQLAPGLNAGYSHNSGIDLSDPGVADLWGPIGKENWASNFAQAAGIPTILRLTGFRCARGNSDPTDDWRLLEEWEPLRPIFAEAEHNRWMVERMLRGWRYGPITIKAEKIHKDLVPFTHLDVEEKVKDEWLIFGRAKTAQSPVIPSVLERLRRIRWRVEKIAETKPES